MSNEDIEEIKMYIKADFAARFIKDKDLKVKIDQVNHDLNIICMNNKDLLNCISGNQGVMVSSQDRDQEWYDQWELYRQAKPSKITPCLAMIDSHMRIVRDKRWMMRA